MDSKGAAAYGHRLVAAVEALLVASFVHRASVARPYGHGQDSGYDIDQQRCGGAWHDVPLPTALSPHPFLKRFSAPNGKYS